MKAGHHERHIIDDPEEQGVGKSAQQRAADIGKDRWKLQWIGGKPLGGVVEFSTEASSQADGFSFVPVLRFACFDLRRG